MIFKIFIDRIFYVSFVVLFLSCATSKPEGEAYKEIKQLNDNHYYSKAANEIFKFEASYPDSIYICELWSIQLQYFQERNTNSNYVEVLKDKKKKKCKK